MPVTDTLIDGWIHLQSTDPNSKEYDKLFWAYEEVYKLVAVDPNEAWNFVLRTLQRDQSPKVMENLSAGPLEDLLAGWGDEVIDRVENEAKTSGLFAQLL